MFKQVKSLYEILDFVYIPAKIFGVAPFDRKYDKIAKKYCYSVRPFGLQHLLLNGGVAFFIFITSFLRIFLEYLQKQMKTTDLTIGAVFVFLQFSAITMIGYFIIKQKYFLRCLKIVEEVDDMFVQRGIPISYVLIQRAGYVIFFIMTPVYIFIVVFPVWRFIESVQIAPFCSYHCRNWLFQLATLSTDYIVRQIPMYFFSVVLYIASERYRGLNEYILKHCDSEDYKTVDSLLDFFIDLHNSLYRLTQDIGQVFSLPMLLIVSHTFLNAVAMMTTFSVNDNLNIYQGLINLFLYCGELTVQLVICQRLKYQMERSQRVENLIWLPYVNEELALKRKSLLLQLTHEKIIITAMEFYDLNMSVVTAHMGLVLTICMFLFKLRSENIGM